VTQQVELVTLPVPAVMSWWVRSRHGDRIEGLVFSHHKSPALAHDL